MASRAIVDYECNIIAAIEHISNNKQYESVDIIVDAPFLTFEEYKSHLMELYIKASNASFRLNNPLLDINVIMTFCCGYDPFLETSSVIYYGHDHEKLDLINSNRSHNHIPAIKMHHVSKDHTFPAHAPKDSIETRYEYVAVGGTFDHLHSGHKILLSIAAFLTSKELTCGVLDSPLRLEKKRASEYIQPIHHRIECVQKFLYKIKRTVSLNIISIADDYGPTITDDRLQALVGTSETRVGCDSVNAERKLRSMKPLEIVIIDVISCAKRLSNAEMELKISSSFIREWISTNKI